MGKYPREPTWEGTRTLIPLDHGLTSILGIKRQMATIVLGDFNFGILPVCFTVYHKGFLAA